jgi:uroporphyrin-III C-methyltransferase / precorrin-2 dehydrogenase / sirohydrochlorin ferrochelatase
MLAMQECKTLDFAKLQLGYELVFYVGLVGLPVICAELINHGKPAETPCALIEKGTRPEQKVYTANLASLSELITSNNVHASTLLIVGWLASSHDKLKWFSG